jgi:hypothetical protein
MNDKDNIYEYFHKTFNNMKGRFHIIDQRIPMDVQVQYFKRAELVRSGDKQLTDEEFEAFREALYDKTPSPERDMEYMLTKLAVSGEVKAFRLLEDYAKRADPEVADWANMALVDSRITIEADLLDEKPVLISTGLGGKGEKMRFYVLIVASGDEPLQQYQREAVTREFDFAMPAEDCEIERMTVGDLHVEMLVLIPAKKDIPGMFNRIIAECNQYGNFHFNTVNVNNVRELPESEVDEIIRQNHGCKNRRAGY